MRFLAVLFSAALLPAVEITLAAPLTTLVPLAVPLSEGGALLSADVVVPADAPADLGVGAYVSDAHGRWFRHALPGALAPGTQHVRIRVGAQDIVVGEAAGWDAGQAGLIRRGGLFFWSASPSRAVLSISDLRSSTLATTAGLQDDTTRLSELTRDAVAHTGERWELHCQPWPFPANPFDPTCFALDLVVTTPSGAEQRIPGFCELPMRGSDRGDREAVVPAGRSRFTVRFRPREPGVHRLRLEASWGGSNAVVATLDPLTVAGPAWDGYARVDAGDPRFFSVAGGLFFPRGPNLRAVADIRCSERLGTRMTPDRGTLAYDAYFARLAPHGANATEVWLSTWNLALEWRGEWPEYHGLGRYSEERAWRLDHVLDSAEANGIRCTIVLNNHGQLSEDVDREWHDNPYNSANGGILPGAAAYFTDPRALAKQDNLRRYIIARWADSPAVLGWKLLSEQDLTAAGRARQLDVLAEWHAHAAERFHALDTYHHPLTTHWSGSFRSVFPPVAAVPGLDFLTIDAYHDTAQGGKGELLSDLLVASTARRGSLARFGKPVLVAEYGGQWSACPEPQLIAEHAASGFIALVAGQAGAPMLWWGEWVDQGAHFAPYEALRGFLAGEELRNPAAQSLTLSVESPGGGWARAWSRPGRMLGYLLDEAWIADGSDTPPHDNTQILIGEQVAPGTMTVAWWDADRGVELSRTVITHAGGALRLTAPAWRHHLAFKLWRG